MTTLRKPLVLVGGVPTQLPAGSALEGIPVVADARTTPAAVLTLAIVHELPAEPDPDTLYFVVEDE